LVGVGHQFKPYNTSHRNKKVDKIGKDKHRKTVNGEEISIFSSSSIKSQKKNTKESARHTVSQREDTLRPQCISPPTLQFGYDATKISSSFDTKWKWISKFQFQFGNRKKAKSKFTSKWLEGGKYQTNTATATSYKVNSKNFSFST